jgi:hypothetical protein
MNREDIIRMAREARLAEHTHPYQLWSASDDGLEHFANLVAAAEREACAKVVEEWLHGEWHNQGVIAALMIRERGAPTLERLNKAAEDNGEPL